MNDIGRVLITGSQAAQKLGRSRRTLARMARRGELTEVKLKPNQSSFFLDEIESLIESKIISRKVA